MQRILFLALCFPTVIYSIYETSCIFYFFYINIFESMHEDGKVAVWSADYAWTQSRAFSFNVLLKMQVVFFFKDKCYIEPVHRHRAFVLPL